MISESISRMTSPYTMNELVGYYENSNLHPCAYFSCTFSSAQCNYDIYDQELLAVILSLEEWRQYIQGTMHPITIITNHKNISYIKDPCKLSRQQARWFLFLQDFDLQWQVTPGTKMAPVDTLSRHDHVDTTQDNQKTAICLEPVIIQVLDLALAWKIWSKLVPLSSLAHPWMTGIWPMATYTSRGTCTFPHMNNRPSPGPYMTPPPQNMQDVSRPKPCWKETSGGQAFPHLSMPLSLDVPYVNKTKSIITPLIPHLPPSLLPLPCLSNSSQSISSPISPLQMDMTH